MMKYGIAVVHKTLAPEAGWLFCLDAPRHREPLDLTRKMTVCGWASHGQSRNAAAVVCRRDDRVSKIGMDQVRSDVAKHVLKTTGRVISDRCGFRFQVPAFEELELFIEEASGALVPLVAISVVAMDALSDSAHDAAFLHPDVPQIGRASCRERV